MDTPYSALDWGPFLQATIGRLSALRAQSPGSGYFYAMELVEGETLENVIKRSGRLEVRLALEIATQVAAGLAAVH